MEGGDYKAREALLGVLVILMWYWFHGECTSVKTYQIVHLQCVQITRQLYLSRAVFQKLIPADYKNTEKY